jgi:hypothetical protein
MKKLIFTFAVICLSLGCLCDAQAGGGGGGGGKGGSAPSAPAMPPPPAPAPAPVPDTTPQEAVSAAVRDDERKKLRQRQGVGGTLLAPLGKTGGGEDGNTLLGRIGN